MEEQRNLSNLRILRIMKGLTQDEIAEKAGITRYAYQKIESGESIPRVSTLQEITKAMDIKLQDVFEPIEMPTAVRFRANKNMKTRDEIIWDSVSWLRRFNELEECVNEKKEYLFRELTEELKKFNQKERPKKAAVKTRRFLYEKGILKSENENIRDSCGLLESSGIKVYPKVIASDSFFGLSIGPRDGGPAIIVNVWERISVERWIFTASHELGHLLLHLDSYNINEFEEDRKQELEANTFAGYFLMPENVFKEEWKDTSGLPFHKRVLKIKRIFQVSFKTVLYRLDSEGMGNDVWKRFYFEFSQIYGKSLGRSDEPNALSADNFLNSYPEALRAHEPENLSHMDFIPDRLARLVELGVKSGKISLSRSAEILNRSIEEMRIWAASWV
jgi:Zn-dependent peptidase ImmA (M78 family)/DNA-binding XRE family transcriptional regulator